MKKPDLSRATQDHWSRIYDSRNLLFVSICIYNSEELTVNGRRVFFQFHKGTIKKSPKTGANIDIKSIQSKHLP